MIPSSACPSWQPDQAGPAGERGDHTAAVTPRAGTRSLGVVHDYLGGCFFIDRIEAPLVLEQAAKVEAEPRDLAKKAPFSRSTAALEVMDA